MASSTGHSMDHLPWPLLYEKLNWAALVTDDLLQLLYQHVRVVRKSVPLHDPTLASTVFCPSHKTLADSLCSSKVMLETIVMAVFDRLQSFLVLHEPNPRCPNLVIFDEQQVLDNAIDEVSFFPVLYRLEDKSHPFVCLSHPLL
jgi:hypothetical protein